MIAWHRRWGLWIGVAVLLLAAVGGGVWWWLHRQVDWEAVYEANNHGIAALEGSHYAEAIPEFEKVVGLAPDWLPGRVNLGIALLNADSDDPAKLPICKAIFEEVLRRQSDNPHAHFCLGVLLMHLKDPQKAIKHFEAVLQKDPDDAYSWYWLGYLKTPASDEQTEAYRQALKRNRHLSGAIYGLAMNLRRGDPKAAMDFLDESQALKRAEWENVAEVRYSRMGPYAEAIGRTSDPPTAPRTGPLFQRRESLKV